MRFSVCNDHLAKGEHCDGCMMIRHEDGRAASAREVWEEMQRLRREGWKELIWSTDANLLREAAAEAEKTGRDHWAEAFIDSAESLE